MRALLTLSVDNNPDAACYTFAIVYLVNEHMFPMYSESPFVIDKPHLLTHGTSIAPVTRLAYALLRAKAQLGIHEFSKSEKAALAAQIQSYEWLKIRDGVNFSRALFPAILRSRDSGEHIDFETLGPYLADYAAHDGIMRTSNLIPEDAIGLHLAGALRKILPDARLVSLYDDHNSGHLGDPGGPRAVSYSTSMVRAFRGSLVTLFKSCGAISEFATEGQEYLLVAESRRVVDAEHLVTRLSTQNFIRRHGDEIAFVNNHAENPLHRHIRLRTKSGRWLCEALDAASFLKSENLSITHIVALPEYMKDQQDKVWEILRVLGIRPEKYHNIFFDPALSPQHVAQVVTQMFTHYERELTT